MQYTDVVILLIVFVVPLGLISAQLRGIAVMLREILEQNAAARGRHATRRSAYKIAAVKHESRLAN